MDAIHVTFSACSFQLTWGFKLVALNQHKPCCSDTKVWAMEWILHIENGITVHPHVYSRGLMWRSHGATSLWLSGEVEAYLCKEFLLLAIRMCYLLCLALNLILIFRLISELVAGLCLCQRTWETVSLCLQSKSQKHSGSLWRSPHNFFSDGLEKKILQF